MSAVFSGPMFERARSGLWESVHKAEGGHYNNFGCLDENGMEALRQFFPDGKAGELNLCLFSTSGIHGTYQTIEEAQDEWRKKQRGEKDEYGDEFHPNVTFLIVQPRICTVRHGNCIPQTEEDFAFLKKLRKSSWTAVAKIGKHS